MSKTSYEHEYGSGDRRSIINLTYDGSFSGKAASGLIDGRDIGTGDWATTSLPGNVSYMKFEFPSKVFIDEVRVHNRTGGWTNIKSVLVGVELDESPIDYEIEEVNREIHLIKFKKRTCKSITLRVRKTTLYDSPYLKEIEFKVADLNGRYLIRIDDRLGYFREVFYDLTHLGITEDAFLESRLTTLSILKEGDHDLDMNLHLKENLIAEREFNLMENDKSLIRFINLSIKTESQDEDINPNDNEVSRNFFIKLGSDFLSISSNSLLIFMLIYTQLLTPIAGHYLGLLKSFMKVNL